MARKPEPRNKPQSKTPIVDIKTQTPGKMTPDQQEKLAREMNQEGMRIAKKVSRIGQTPTKGKK
jgi:hypothetical protein